MGLHFLDWIDCNGVTFSLELMEWGCTYSKFEKKSEIHFRVTDLPDFMR